MLLSGLASGHPENVGDGVAARRCRQCARLQFSCPKLQNRGSGEGETVDVLSDVLRNVRLSGAVLFFAEYRAPWSIACPPSADIAPLFVPGAVQLVVFHIVIDGACLVSRPGEAPVELKSGDAVLMAQGDPHRMADRPGRPPVPIVELLPAPPWPRPPLLVHGGEGALTRVLCGFLHCADAQLSPFLAGLPPVLRVEGGDALRSSLLSVQRLLVAEAREGRPGCACVLARLTETFFVEALRQHMTADAAPSALAALKDPVVGAALARLHGEPMRDWNVDALAADVAVSRSLLAARFTEAMGCPPMHYLARWRLLTAARQLEEGRSSIAQVAAAVGYESEASFSRAFKRHLGAPPATWLGRRSATP
jgi:AraC-like DNA-binding protein